MDVKFPPGGPEPFYCGSSVGMCPLWRRCRAGVANPLCGCAAPAVIRAAFLKKSMGGHSQMFEPETYAKSAASRSAVFSRYCVILFPGLSAPNGISRMFGPEINTLKVEPLSGDASSYFMPSPYLPELLGSASVYAGIIRNETYDKARGTSILLQSPGNKLAVGTQRR